MKGKDISGTGQLKPGVSSSLMTRPNRKAADGRKHAGHFNPVPHQSINGPTDTKRNQGQSQYGMQPGHPNIGKTKMHSDNKAGRRGIR